MVSNPLRTRAIADAKIKTDSVDALTLAQLLQADFIPQVWIPDETTRARRREVAARAALVRQRTQLRNRVHSVLHRNLVQAPLSDLFGAGGRRWLATVELPEPEREELAARCVSLSRSRLRSCALTSAWRTWRSRTGAWSGS